MLGDPAGERPPVHTSLQRFLAVLAGAAAAATLSACATADEDATDGALDAPAATVAVAGFAYDPASIRVGVGDRVTWTNDDSVGHTVTAGTPGEPGDDFDESLGGSGGTASITFDEPGQFEYFCRIHPRMTGEVVVESG